MSFDVAGTDFAAFKSIADGKWNHGSVVVSGEGLSKVNHHHTFTVFNHHVNTSAENQAVRVALYNAILDKGGASLTDEQLSAIREKLGLSLAEGNEQVVAEGAIGSADLTRRDIKQILGFVREVEKGDAAHSGALNDLVKSCIAQAQEPNFPMERALLLTANLRDQMKNWQSVFNRSIVNVFKTMDTARIDDNADAIGDLTSHLKNNMLAVGQAFVAKAMTFVTFATTKAGEKTAQIRNQIEQDIGKFTARLGELEGATDNERNEVTALINQMRECSDGIAQRFTEKINAKIGQLSCEEFFGKDLEELAEGFILEVNPTVCNDAMLASEKIVAKLDSIKTRLDTEERVRIEENERLANEARIAAEKALNAGRDAIAVKLADTKASLENIGREIERITKFADELSKNPRADERLDGDAIRNQMADCKLLAAHANAINGLNGLSTDFANKFDSLTADTVGGYKDKMAKDCDQLVKHLADKVDNLIKELNGGKLKLTVLPERGANDSEVQSANRRTDELRQGLTNKLNTEWAEAVNDFTALADEVRGKPEYAQFSPELQKELDDCLENVKARFSEENRKAFVTRHLVGDAKPGDILAKAKQDVQLMMANALTVHAANVHAALQNDLNLVAKWMAHDSEALNNLVSDFEKLTGCSLNELAKGDADKRQWLFDALIYRLDGLEGSVNTLAKKVLAGTMKAADAHSMLLNNHLKGIAKDLAQDKLLERAGNASRLLKEIDDGFSQYVEKYLKALEVNEGMAEQLRQDVQKMQQGLKMHVLTRYVCAGRWQDADAKKVGNLKNNFCDLVEARKLRASYLETLGNDYQQLSKKLENADDRTKAKLKERHDDIYLVSKALSADNANVGQVPTLSLEALKSMKTAKGLFKTVTFDLNAAKEAIEKGDRLPTTFEEMMLLANVKHSRPEVALGKGPKAKNLMDGVDGQVVGPDGPGPDERQMPVLDRIVIGGEMR